MADMGYYRRGVLGVVFVVVGWEETARDERVSEPCTASQTMLLYSHPQQAQTNLVYGVLGYVSQEGSDYQFKQCCYPASPCEEEGREKGSVLVNVSVSTLRDDQCDECWSAQTENRGLFRKCRADLEINCFVLR